MTATKRRGVNRVIWNLRYADLAPAGPVVATGEEGAPGGGRPRGRFVSPGDYTVRLRVDGQQYEKKMAVREDPRIDITAADARAWRETQATAGELYKRAVAIDARLTSAAAGPTLAERRRLARELMGRLSSLYNDLDRWTGRPTAGQLSRLAHYRSLVETLER